MTNGTAARFFLYALVLVVALRKPNGGEPEAGEGEREAEIRMGGR
jgi:hypothetical protein